jgi:hypothetical protein
MDNPVKFVSSRASNLNVLLAKNGLKYAFTASVSPAETLTEATYKPSYCL